LRAPRTPAAGRTVPNPWSRPRCWGGSTHHSPHAEALDKRGLRRGKTRRRNTMFHTMQTRRHTGTQSLSRAAKHLALISLSLAGIAGLSGCGKDPKNITGTPGQLEVTPSQLDFGSIFVGQDATRSLVVRNIGGEPVDLQPHFTAAG